MGHLGPRVSALLDGQLSPAETERAWAHVHVCHQCRDAVEREGWVKTRLAGLATGSTTAPEWLKGSLRGGAPLPAMPQPLSDPHPRRIAMVALGGSAAGVAVLGVLALGLGPSDAPNPDRRAPVTEFRGTDAPMPMPSRVPGPVLRPAAR